MKQLIIFATGNKGKIREIRDIITDPDTEVLSMKEAGVAADPDESGATFEENALIKARAVAKLVRQKIEDGTFFFDGADGTRSFDTDDIQITVMSDDSGLVIDALNGEPGIYSARYLGHDTDYNYKMTQIMKRMENVPDEERTARFVAAVAAVFPDGSEHVVRGAMEGVIAHGIYGKNGFGYDPFFYLPEYGKTSAEITEEEKNAISHRGKALRAMLKVLDEWRSTKTSEIHTRRTIFSYGSLPRKKNTTLFCTQGTSREVSSSIASSRTRPFMLLREIMIFLRTLPMRES